MPATEVIEQIRRLRDRTACWEAQAAAADADTAGWLRFRAHGGGRRLARLEWVAQM